MTLAFYCMSAVLGLIFGSFLSMLSPRLHHQQKGIVTGRSQCPLCHHTLGAVELIPLVSYLLQKGRCKHCHKKVSAWYPATELLSSLSFLGLALWVKDPLEWLTIVPILFTLLFIFIYDLRYKEIHEVVLIPGIIYAGLWAFFTQDFASSIWGALLAVSFFGLQYLLSKGRWLGSGDIEIGLFMGLVLGVKLTGVALLLSYMLGSMVGMLLLLSSKANGKTAVPLGPFLVVGTMLSWIHGNTLIEWYLNLLP